MSKKLFLIPAVFGALLVAASANAAAFNPTGSGGSATTAHVTVVTQVVGGSALPESFLMTYGDGVSTVATFPGTASPGFSLNVQPGIYQVQGSDQAGYAKTFSAGCSGTLSTGDSVDCTVTYTATGGGSSCDTPDCANPTGCTNPDGCLGTPAPPPDLGCTNPDGCVSIPTPPGGTTDPNGGTTPPATGSTDPNADQSPLPRTGGSELPLILTATLGAYVAYRTRN